jgi:hypothetical protein
VQGGHDPGGDRAREPERAADGDGELPDLEIGGAAEELGRTTVMRSASATTWLLVTM